jgi:hypothetical protein
MKFVMTCHLYVVDIFLIGNKYNFKGLIIQLQLHVQSIWSIMFSLLLLGQLSLIHLHFFLTTLTPCNKSCETT